MDLNDLRYFELVVRHRGFSAAERHAHVTKSKLSRRIRLLEEEVGANLLRRSTRRMSLTVAGQAFYEHCTAMVLEADAAKDAVERLLREPTGTVRMTCSYGIEESHITELIADFMVLYPKVRVEFSVCDRPVSLIEEHCDIALQIGENTLADSSLVMRRIASGHEVLVASPAYLARKAPIEQPAQLSCHDTIGMLSDGSEQNWLLEATDGRVAEILLRPRFLCSDYTTQRQAALSGIGVSLLPLRMAWRALSEGKLSHVATAWGAPGIAIYLVFLRRRGMLPSMRALIDHLVKRMPAALAK